MWPLAASLRLQGVRERASTVDIQNKEMNMKVQIAFNVDETVLEDITEEAARILNDIAERIQIDRIRFNDVYRIFDKKSVPVGQLVVSKQNESAEERLLAAEPIMDKDKKNRAALCLLFSLPIRRTLLRTGKVR
jgi:hypothetical protein